MLQGVIDSLDVVGCNYLLQVYVNILALALKSCMKSLLKTQKISVKFFKAEKLLRPLSEKLGRNLNSLFLPIEAGRDKIYQFLRSFSLFLKIV